MANVGEKTGKKTQAGRDVYKTPEGEMVSEKSTTFEYKGKWINIPTIHDGKQYSQDQLIDMLDKGLIKPTSVHNKLQEAIKAAKNRSKSLKFNEGGLSEQMDSMLPAVDDDTRSTKEYLEDTKPMDISSVPAFQRPMDASDNDPLVGEDDAGNPVYRTMLGNTYTVRRNPDQRTTRTKIEEDLLPAVRDYLADPTAPTADQTIAAAKAIVGDAWETISIPGDLLSGEKGASDVTLGEVFELTGGTAAASTMFDVPGGRDTLRIFGGARAKYPPNMTGYGSIDSTFNAEADFKTLENLSVDFENDPTGSLVRVMDELERNPSKYPATLKEVVAGNWFRGRDDLMRFEIDDSQSEILGNGVGDIVRMGEDDMDAYLRGFSFDVDSKFPDNSIQGMPGEKAFTTLEDILKHDQLYNQYPQLRNAPVIEDTAYFKRNPSVLGYFDDSSGTIAINTNKITTNEELRDTLLHEVQHLVQHLEGFESGTNVRNADVLEIKKAVEGSPEYQKAFTDYSAKVSKYLENRDSATVAVYNKNKEVASKVLDIILDDFSAKTEIPVEEIYERLTKGETFDDIKMSVSPDIRSRGFIYSLDFEPILHIAEGNVGGMAPNSSIDLSRSLDDVNPRESAAPYFEMLSGKDKIDLIADNNRWQQHRLASTTRSLIKDNPELAKDFEDSLGFSVQDFVDASSSQDAMGKLYGIPDVVPPTKPKIVRNYVIYSSKRGEVEARNVSARKDMAASERTPENVFDTEDTPANRQWGEPEVKRARSGQNPITGFANGPSASESYRANPSVEPEVEKAFTELADIQRGAPELAMVEAQMLYGGGVMPYALEHAGDLTHRMAERGGRYGEEFVQPKVTRLLNSLLSDYGFEKEMLENIQSNARFQYEKKNPGISFEEFKKDYEQNLDKALKKYSEAHKKVPVYNQIQLAGREAAIAIGEKRYTDAIEHLYIIDQAIKDGTYKQAALEFDPSIDFRNKNGFAEGGTVDMNQQMSFAFADGGLRDDGMREDPVSGNEVPSGSMAKEVRDDIPAQLSEGEYVVPADVVRYYGVKFFEDLRDAAKMGLQDMEARGRIGGEPVPADGPMNEDDLTPEELSAIQEMMGMSEGGTVAGFAPGGLQTDQDFLAAGQQAQQNQFTGFPLGATIFPRAESGEIEAVPTTPTITTEETAESCAAKDMDYNPTTKTCVPRAVATTTPAPSDDDSPRVEPPKWHEKYDYADTNKLVSQSLATLGVDSGTEEKETQNTLQKIAGSIGQGIGNMLEGGILGGVIRQQKVAEVAANAQLLRAQGKTKEAEMLEDAIDGYRTKHDIEPGGFFDSTKTLAKQLADKYSDLTYDEENETIIRPGDTTTKAPAPKTTPTPTSEPTPTPTSEPTKSPATAAASLAKQASNADNSSQLAAIQKAQKIAQKAADAGTSIAEQTQTGSGGYGSSSSSDEPTGGKGSVSKGSGWGGMNQGGLMAGKPKKKAKRQYKKGGLAGKK